MIDGIKEGMNTRVKISVLLVGLGILLAFMPVNPGKTFRLNPTELVEKSAAGNSFTVDEVARFINAEDSTVQLIDLRSDAEFRQCNIPGSVNIPFNEMMTPEWRSLLNNKKMKTIFYSNDDYLANMAWSISTGLGNNKSYVMKGGLNEWFEVIMLSRFDGEQITARENALFENRYRARAAFNQINSLPDSLKTKYFDSKRMQRKKLDGGCG